MFESAIENVLKFTRPIHTITRTYGGMILPGTATLFFVNDNGVAVTCKHVANLITSSEQINQGYDKFRNERDKLPRDNKFPRQLQGLELKYHFQKETTIQMKNNFMNCFDRIDQIVCHQHPTLDLAILDFRGFNVKYYEGHAVFSKNSALIRQGKYLCRIGFPFPEFTNFRYDDARDEIEWTNTGNINSPSFPIDGIVTRFIGDPSSGQIIGIEMSTPGLKGQSGGPLFDVNGTVMGMQFATSHLHLGFDLDDKEIIQGGKRTKVSNHPFLHVGMCIHPDQIKKFLREFNIEFFEV